MADSFQPKFVDLVRNYTTSVGTADFKLGPAVNGYAAFGAACQIGDSFYYSAIGVDKPAEREVGRGTLKSDGTISRDPVSGTKTNFSSGTKAIALIAAAEWFEAAQSLVESVSPVGQALASAPSAADARGTLDLGAASLLDSDTDAALSANSDARVPTQKAAKAYVDGTSAAPSIKRSGAMLDGATDDTGAANASLASIGNLFLPAGTLIASALSVPADRQLRTAGLGARIKQKAGTAANTRIVSADGSNLDIGDVSLEGQLGQAGDTTGEQNHGLVAKPTAGTLNLLSFGNLAGSNIRGDVFYAGAASGCATTQVSVGHVNAANSYRNGVTVAGGVRALDIKSIVAGTAGMTALDIEPNVGEPDVRGVRVGYVEGRALQVAASGQKISGVQIGAAYLSPTAYGAGSIPAYPATLTNAFAFRDSQVRIGKFKADGYDGSAMTPASGGAATSHVEIGDAELTNCCQGASFLTQGYIVGAGTSGASVLYRIGKLAATTTNASHRVLQNINGALVGRADIGLLSGSRYVSDATDCITSTLNLTKVDGGNGGMVATTATRCGFIGGTAVCDRFFSFAVRSWALGVEVTTVTGPDVSGTNNAFLLSRLNGIFYHLWGVNGTLQLDGSGNFTTPGYVRATSDIRSFSPSGGVGYANGAGGTIVQATSKSTAVTLNKVCGQVTTSAAALAAGAVVEFAVINSAVAASDTINLNLASGTATSSAYRYWVSGVAAGSFKLCIENRSAGSLSEALVLNFAVLKAVAA